MKSIDEITEVLSDLMRINKDRVEGYKRASYDTSLSDLKSLFCDRADESRKNITELMKEIMILNWAPEMNEIADAGDIYKTWMDIKANFSGNNINHVLNSCEFAEVAVLNAYKEARVGSSNTQIEELIERQEQSLKTSYEGIKAYRHVYTKDESYFLEKHKDNGFIKQHSPV